MNIMISHEHREMQVAMAWKRLLDKVGGGEITTWFSSDPQSDGGIRVGQWWQELVHQITASHFILATVTRQSQDRPWILWECGLASGQTTTKGVIPVLIGFSSGDLKGPLANFQSYQGDDLKSVEKLTRLLATESGVVINDEELSKAITDEYLPTIREFIDSEPLNRLFGKGFHKSDPTLSGVWDCIWYDEKDDIFETDSIHLYMEEDKVRIIGKGAKGYEYPMEGRLSPMRYLALNYWSVASLATCGTVILQVSSSGKRMKGEWMGHTTKDYEEDDIHLTRGKIVCTKR